LDDPDQYSSAYDLAVIGAYALTKPELRRVFTTPDVIIASSKEPGHEHGWFHPGNLNSLISTYRGAIGIKPGYTEDAGYTLVGAAERDGKTLICVSLNSRRHFSDCTALLDFGFARAAPAAAQSTPAAPAPPLPLAGASVPRAPGPGSRAGPTPLAPRVCSVSIPDPGSSSPARSRPAAAGRRTPPPPHGPGMRRTVHFPSPAGPT